MNVMDITLDTVRSYAQSCMDVHLRIEELKTDGYDLLVVPSRGASPFVGGGRSYAYALRNERYTDFDPDAPRIMSMEELYLPFTADVDDSFEIQSGSIRNFWSRVLAALIRRDGSDIALSFYRYLRALSGDLATGSARIRGGKNGRFVFIDTVVSGQAVCEIFDGFAQYNLDNCHYILLIDNVGRHLKPEYALKIQSMVDAGRATKILIERIFTEDEGPAMSGIWSVTMPELMMQAQKIIPDLQYSVGAGLYYHEVARRKDNSNVDITMSNAMLGIMLYSAVHLNDESTQHFLEKFQMHISGRSLQDQRYTMRIAEPLILRNFRNVKTTSVSGSHVLRAHLTERDAEKLVRNFLDAQRAIS